MSTVAELKSILKFNNIKGYSNKNKEQLLKMVNEFKEQKVNIFSRLPNVNISQIGQYLNYKDITRTFVSEKKT